MKFRRKKKSKKKKESVSDDKENEHAEEDKQPTDVPKSESTDSIAGATEDQNETPTVEGPSDPATPNGDMKPEFGSTERSVSIKTVEGTTEKKSSKLAAFTRIFKPWKWRRKKKTSEKFHKTAVDLERKISVRTSREELIKRGVLKEVDENGQPITFVDDAISEDDEDQELHTTNGEAVNEKGDAYTESCDHKQANGSAATTPTLPTHSLDEHLPNSITRDGEILPPPDHSISLSPAYHTQRPVSTPVTSVNNMGHYEEDVHRPESMSVEPKHIRVMLPVEDKDRHISVIQKTVQIPGVHEHTENSPLPTHVHPLVNMSNPYSTHSPMLNNNVYTPTGGLTYPTPTLKAHITTQPSYPPSTPTGSIYPHEVPCSEPDMHKKPLRSALKGSKSKELLQQQLQQRLQQKHLQLQSRDGSLQRAPPPRTAPKPRVGLVNAARISDPHSKENMESYDNIPDYYSDSDEEIQYDDRDRESILAAKVERQDSLAKFLSQRPEKRVLVERNILPNRSENERLMEKNMIGNRLTRRLSLRPTAEELENRNILHSKSHDEYMKEKEEKKKVLIRKLSFRPSVDELRQRKIIKFSDYVEMTDANEYDRRADKPWTRLTPRDKASIRKELNEFKSTEMDVHDESRHLTRFHRP